MSAYAALELVVVGLAVAAAAWGLVKPWLGRRQAASASQDAAACAGQVQGACGSCGGCAPASGKEQPLRFHR